MAYEISSSVGTSGITPQVVHSENASAQWEGGAINPAGTIVAVPSYRHLGAADGGTANYGIEILTSGSSGFAKNDSIDTGATGIVRWIKFKSDNEFYAALHTGYVYNYVSSSSGWAQGSESINVGSNEAYHGYFNHNFTQLAAHEFYNPQTTTHMDDAKTLKFFESGSGGWSSKGTFTGVGRTTSVSWINDDTVMVGQPAPGSPANGRIYVLDHDGSSWSAIETCDGERNGTYPYGYFGAGLYYHTASNSTIISTMNGSGYARFFVMPSGSYGYLPNSAIAGHLAGIFTEIDTSHLTASGRTYLRAPSFGSGWNIDPASGNRIVLSSLDDLGSQRDEKVYFALESGSEGWKASKAINDDCDGIGNIRQGDQHSQISNGGSTLVTWTTGSYTSGISKVSIYSILAADPAVPSVVSQEVSTSEATTLTCGGTQASPDLSISFQAGTLATTTTIGCDSTIETDPRKNGITKTQPGALAASKVFSITPHGTNFNADKPATFTFSLTGDYAGTEPANLRLVKRLNDSSPWQEIPRSAWSNSGGTITLSVYSLSQFGAIIGGNTMARTKLNNYQLEKLLSGGTGANSIGASAKALDIIGSGSGDEQISEISAVGSIADHYFVVQSSSGVTPQKIGVGVLQSYFSNLDITTAANDNEYSMVFVSGTGEQAIQVDASGFTYNPSADRLTVANISASADVDIAGALDIDGAVAARSTLTVTGLISGSGGMDIAGQADFGGAVNVQGAFDVDGATTLDGLTVAEAADFSSTVSVTGLISGSGGIDIAGAADFGAAVNVQGALDVDGATTLDGLTVAEAAVFQSTISGSGDISGAGDLNIDGAADLRSSLAVAGNADLNGQLDVAGQVDLAASGVATSVRGTLAVSEAATFSSTISGSGDISGAGALNIDGAADLRSTLAVAGNADLNGELDVAGATSLAASGLLTDIRGTLSVDEAATFDSSVTIAGNLTVQGTTTSVDSQNTLLQDPLMVLGSSSNGVSADGDRGLILELTSSNNKAMFWDQSAGEFAFVDTTSNHDATVVATTDYADLHIGGLTADDASSFGGDVSVTGDVSASADLYAAGNAIVAGAVTASFFSGDGSGLSGVGAETIASNNDDNDLALTFVSGAGIAAAKLYVDVSNLAYNTSTDTLKTVNFSASSDVDIAGTLDVDGAADLRSSLNVAGLISGSAGMDLAGQADFGGAVNIQGALDVDGATTLDGLTVAEAADFSSTVSVTGLISGSGGLDIAGAADFGAAVNVQGALDVDGATTLDGLTVAEAADFSSTVSVTGLISGSGGIDIAGAADFGAAVNVQGALDVDGATTLDGLTVAEAAVFQSTISGSGDISGAGALNIDGAADLRSTLAVAGNADLNGQLDVAGQVDLAASGVATSVRGTLAVSEAATFSSTISGSGDISGAGALNIDGATELRDSLTLSGVSEVTANLVNDSFYILDSDDSQVHRDSIADVFQLAKGDGIQVTSAGLISVSASQEIFQSSSLTSGLTASLAVNISSGMLANSLAVYLNGMLQLESGSISGIYDYRTSGSDILMEAALDSDDILTVRYIKK